MLTLNQQKLTFSDIYSFAASSEPVKLGNKAISKVSATRNALEKLIKNNKTIYGVNTGFGAFRNTAITQPQLNQLQKNLILSHAAGVGPPLSPELVRATMLLICNYLSKGFSGVRPVVIETLIKMLNRGVFPIIPEKGSVGASGDLAPSAHLMLVLIGKGEAIVNGQRISGKQALKKTNISPLELEAKEGLALINNTSTMTATAVFALAESQKLLQVADIAGALSAEAHQATPAAFDPAIHRIKPHPGQIAVARNLLRLLKGSKFLDKKVVQNQYSLRCMPQIHGAVADAVNYVKIVVNTEINSVTDNPLIFTGNNQTPRVLSGGNFHGEALAMAMDMLAIAISELANVSERRTASLINPATNNGLPAFLIANGGVNSGLMIAQYTAASLVSENKVLAHPASVDSIPTSADVEDLVSMGPIAARKARQIAENTKNVLAIELMCAAQAINLRQKPLKQLGKGTGKHFAEIRSRIPYLETDSELSPLIGKLTEYIDTF